MQLEDYADLPDPLTQERLRANEPALRRVKAALEAMHSGPLYFPFALSEKRPVRTAQGYLTKFPAGLVDGLPELSAVFADVDLPSREDTPGQRDRRRSGAGWMRDPVTRRAIEMRAVEWTMTHLSEGGWHVENVGDWYSYDVRACRGAEEMHVEVKGTTGDASTVELTANEVTEDAGTSRLLVVVDRIDCHRTGSEVVATGGRPRIWWNWEPAKENLAITRYRYTLPDGWIDT